jgi:hypothetical protein
VSTVNSDPWQQRGNTVMDQFEITSAYGIPHLSVVDGFYPFDSSMKKYWYKDVYKGDQRTHLTNMGHHMVAAYTTSLLDLLVCICEQDTSGTQSWYVYSPRRPLYATPEAILLHTTKVPYRVALHTSEPERGVCSAHATGFAKYADVPNKFGYIGTKVGDKLSVVLPAWTNVSVPYEHVTVEYLASYEGMGIMQLTLVACDDECGVDSGAHEGISTVTDCLDVTNHVSISRTTHLNISSYYQLNHEISSERPRRLQSRTPINRLGSYTSNAEWKKRHQEKRKKQVAHERHTAQAAKQRRCEKLKLTIEIVKSPQPRLQNKVKLFSITMY